MKNKVIFPIGFALSLLLCAIVSNSALAQSQDTEAIFTEKSEAIAAVYEKDVADAGTRFVQALDTHYANLQRDGDLDGMLIVKKLKDTWTESQSVGSEPVSDPRTEKARLAMLKLLNNAGTKRDTATLKLLKAYVTALPRLQKDLTIAGEFEQAIAVKEKIATTNARIAEIETSLSMAKTLKGSRPASRAGFTKTPARFIRLHIDAAHYGSEVQLAEIEFHDEDDRKIPVKITQHPASYSSSWHYDKVLDGNPDTGWANANEEDGNFPFPFVFEHSRSGTFKLAKARLHTRTGGSRSYRIKAFSLYTSTDGIRWQPCLGGEIPAREEKPSGWEEFSCNPKGAPVTFE